jgi:hypothetical protein
VIRVPEEVLVFTRLAAFGLIVGTVYWFVAYEAAGTVLLLAFGIATAVASIILWVRSRKERGETELWLLGKEHGPIPAPAYAPFHVGVGAGIVALGLAFSPLLVLTGLVVMVIGARYWLEAAMRESDSVAPQDRRDGPPS